MAGPQGSPGTPGPAGLSATMNSAFVQANDSVQAGAVILRKSMVVEDGQRLWVQGTASVLMSPGQGTRIQVGIGNTGYVLHYAYNGSDGPAYQTVPFNAMTDELPPGTYEITVVSYADVGAPATIADRTLSVLVFRH